MTYTRILTNSVSAAPYAVNVRDTATNTGPAFTPDIGIDTIPPKVTATTSGTSSATTVNLVVTDLIE